MFSNSLSKLRTSLAEFFSCKLCWQVTLAVFFSILIVEAIILIPSVLKEQNRLINQYEAILEAKLETLVAKHPTEDALKHFFENDRKDYLNTLPLNLLFLKVSTASNENIYQISMDSTNAASPNKLNQETIEALATLESEQQNFAQKMRMIGDHTIAIHWKFDNFPTPTEVTGIFEKRKITQEVAQFILRIVGLVIFIAFFVTIATLMSLRKRVLAPLLDLRNGLQKAGDNPEHPEQVSLGKNEKNELGDVTNSFNRLLLKQFTLLNQLHRNEQALATANESLEQRVLERTEALSQANSALHEEINARYDAQERAHQYAYYDQVTALPNRVKLNDDLQQLRKANHHIPASLIHIDLKGFTQLNQIYGHQIGDHVLKTVAHRISEIAETQSAARVGADEFSVLVLNKSIQDSETMANSLSTAISQPLDLSGQKVSISSYIGVAHYPQPTKDVDQLLNNAMAATREAARRESKSSVLFCPAIGEAIRRRNKLHQDLRKAIDNDELSMVYQPKIALATESLQGAEALIRWQHPELGTISPVEFIPIAEESGIMPAMGDWILNESLAQTKRWVENISADFQMAINLSAQQFQDENLVSRFNQLCTIHNVSPKSVELELTESMLISGEEHIISLMRSLKSTGVRLAIDDFGTGYSSLSYLSKFPVDTLKIDRSFIKDLPTREQDRSIVQTIISLAKNLNMKIVAEGLEAQEHRKILSGWSVELVQGYFYSPPLSPDAFFDWAKTKETSDKVSSA